MSEFYESNDMIEDEYDNSSIDINVQKFKFKYNELKKLLNHLISLYILFEDDFYVNKNDQSKYLKICNIMELCRIFHDYYLCRNFSILSTAYHIIEKSVITDDIVDEDLFMYCTAYIFIKLNDEPHKHEELFYLILDISEYYEKYLYNHSKYLFDMIELEEELDNISL